MFKYRILEIVLYGNHMCTSYMCSYVVFSQAFGSRRTEALNALVWGNNSQWCPSLLIITLSRAHDHGQYMLMFAVEM